MILRCSVACNWEAQVWCALISTTVPKGFDLQEKIICNYHHMIANRDTIALALALALVTWPQIVAEVPNVGKGFPTYLQSAGSSCRDDWVIAEVQRDLVSISGGNVHLSGSHRHAEHKWIKPIHNTILQQEMKVVTELLHIKVRTGMKVVRISSSKS